MTTPTTAAPAVQTAGLSLRGVRKAFGALRAVDGLDLEVRARRHQGRRAVRRHAAAAAVFAALMWVLAVRQMRRRLVD